jgi:hypothetical protein
MLVYSLLWYISINSEVTMYSGKILWLCNRYGNGIILADIEGYTVEIYFDSSVFPEFKDAKPKDIVSFTPNVVSRVNCAREVKLLK